MYLTSFIFLSTITLLCRAEDYYELLGLKRNVDHREIRRAFKKLAVTLHPDKNSDDPTAHDKFVKLTTAYEVLKDPDSRKKYDLYGEDGLDGSNARKGYHSWNYYQNNFGIYDDDPRVVTLNRNDFYESVIDSEKMWFINFYSPMCSHCHTLAPVWRRVAKDLEGVIRIGAVNCEDDWQLCNQIGIGSYPTLLHYPKNSKHGVRYTDEKSHEAIERFVLDKIDSTVYEINKSTWDLLLRGSESTERPSLVFVRGKDSECFTSDDRLKIAAIFDKMIDVRIFVCGEEKCDDRFAGESGAVYLPARAADSSFAPVFFDCFDDANDLVQKILEQLPEPRDLSADNFAEIRERLTSKSDVGWLVCFYMGHATELDLQLKRLPSIVRDINLGKVHCGKYSDLCHGLNVNRYPVWGVLKPGGAFELSHGKNTINDIAQFAKYSIRAKNVHALSAEKILSIMQRRNDANAWFIDWYAPWCPPCMQFLPELRKASLEFKPAVVQFGTVDCTVHSTICRQYNIRSYPTGMLINGSNTLQFTGEKTATNVIRFINEARNPSVIRITSKNFKEKLAKKKGKTLWVVDYFAPWCGPCQQLAPEWTATAKALRVLSFVKVASIDCEAESALCGSQGIRSYPTIRLYPLGSDGLAKVALYNGMRDSVSLLKWISNFFPVKVEDLNADTLEGEVLSGDKVWLIDFYAPWCDHCQRLEPHFAIAAQLLEGKARLARLNCDNYRQHCSRAGVRAYPTLMVYSPRQNRRSNYEGEQIGATSAEGIKGEVLNYLSSMTKQDRDEL